MSNRQFSRLASTTDNYESWHVAWLRFEQEFDKLLGYVGYPSTGVGEWDFFVNGKDRATNTDVRFSGKTTDGTFYLRMRIDGQAAVSFTGSSAEECWDLAHADLQEQLS